MLFYTDLIFGKMHLHTLLYILNIAQNICICFAMLLLYEKNIVFCNHIYMYMWIIS